MAINKNAHIRYQVLDRCFKNTGRNYTIEDLLDECNQALVIDDPQTEGIKRRQLYDDIKFMESEAGFGVEFNKKRIGRKVCYSYLDPNFSINNQPVNESEVAQLKSALQILNRFSGSPQFEWVQELIPKLENQFGLIKKDNPCISFETNIDLKGIEHLSPLFNAILNKRVLQINYQNFKANEVEVFDFHPYYLKQYNNRWFVFGYNPNEENYYWNLALDRISSIKELNSTSYHQQNIDWDDYFYDMIGVTKYQDSELQDVELLFDSQTAPYVQTKPLHPSQKHQITDQGLVVKLKLHLNYELEQNILAFGEKVTVLSPNTLKEKIRSRIEVSLKNYNN